MSTCCSFPGAEELLEEGCLVALGQDFPLWGQGQIGDRDGDGVMPPMPAPGTLQHLHPPVSGVGGPCG